ncbi:dihydroxy-acid dehydratase [Asticcacaulis sp. ZE23SCel15]|uniref:dihydroxy-acid dehydratase domain-containing protein n=1 Tax=Asticcacaulis sp. ZE23SCel15 TaxID=3059027 RepID=UPI00265E3C0F|nr:dihydroxy-acid dehydratase [Asticcacaulis sp. ZE23SCel15]WKL58044.1 dihydroxy-acid dehydratase [Asticcacaulis sp. ZE23SCel15]
MNAQIKMTSPATEAASFEASTFLVASIAGAQKVVSGFAILHGSIAPVGGILKLSGFGDRFEGAARVFEDEMTAIAAIRAGEIAAGTAIVIRHKTDLRDIVDAIERSGITGIALISDGHIAGSTANAMIVGNCAPAAQGGGNIGRLRDGDMITIDATSRRIDTTADLSGRKSSFTAPARGYQGHPALEKYARVMTAAS